MRKQQTESIPESVGEFFAWILRVLASIVVILIIAVMPFYFREGYTHIGSDKSYFFRSGIKMLGKLIMPVFLPWLLCFLAAAFLRRHKGMLREWRQAFSVTDVFALLYGLSVIVSYVCSDYKSTALWGTSGWYMGLVPQLALVAVYFLVSRFQFRKAAKWLLGLCLPASAAVFALGYLNRFDLWPLDVKYTVLPAFLRMENSGLPAFISTIGNINWYCGYAVAIVFVGVGLLWLDRGERLRGTILLSVYSFLGFAALITQGSDSGIFALAVVFLALFLCSVRDGESRRMERFWLLVMLLAGAGMTTMGLRVLFPGRMNFTSGLGNLLTCSPLPALLFLTAAAGLWFEGRVGRGSRGGKQGQLSRKTAELYRRVLRAAARALGVGIPAAAVVFVLMIAVNTLRPGSLGPLSEQAVFTFDNKWGSHRGATWSLGARCFWEQDRLHKLTGVGPDCMADFLYAADGTGASPRLVDAAKEAFVNRRLTNAHCEFLTILVDMGILGAFSFGGMMFGAAARLMRARRQTFASPDAAFAAACGICVLAYMANNLWSFQQSMSVATIYVVLGMGEWFARAN